MIQKIEFSLQSNPVDLHFDNNTSLSKKLKKHKKVKNRVRAFRKSNYLTKDYDITFIKGDFSGAFHLVTLSFTRFDVGEIRCELSDCYDFKFEKYDSLTNFANNYQTVSMYWGASHEYDITVEMLFKDKSLNKMPKT